MTAAYNDQLLDEENRRLRRAVEELSVLNDIAVAISSTISLDRVVDLIVEKCVRHLKVEQGAVSLLEEEESQQPFRTLVRRIRSDQEEIPLRFSNELVGWMLHHKQPLLTNDLEQDPRFHEAVDAAFPIRSLLSAPLILHGKLTGLLSVFNKQAPEGFTEDDQRLLTIIAGQSAQVIENARLYEEEKELHQVREELRVAYRTQVNLLPDANPLLPGYDIAGISHPAQNVGGDYYDFITIDAHRLGLCLCDASGKGMPAALLMSNTQATIRGQVLLKVSPRDCMRWANAMLYRSTDIRTFVTAFYAVLDTDRHTVCYSNAGHNPPIHLSSQAEPMLLREGGTVLGVMEDLSYQEDTVSLKSGDMLVIYSDGITETLNSHCEEFGEDRLIQMIRRSQNISALELIERILSAIDDFSGGAPQSDDRTLIVVRREDGI